MKDADWTRIPGLPVDDEGPVFKEPWEARAFAMAVQLQQQGAFTWNEWAQTLGATLARARDAGGPDSGVDYYLHWLSCLEQLATRKGFATPDALAAGKQAAHETHQRLHAGAHEHHHDHDR